MADADDAGGWGKLLDRLQSPGDWVAAGIGALGGAAVSVLVLGSDFGTSVATGAVAGVTAKATGDAALKSRRLRKKSERFRRRLEASLKDTEQDPSLSRTEVVKKIQARLVNQSILWKDKLITNEKFEAVIDSLIEEYSKQNES